MLAIDDPTTWLPLLGFLWENDADSLGFPGAYIVGRVDRFGGFGFSASPGGSALPSRSAFLAVAHGLGPDPIALIRGALTDAGMDGISYVAHFSPDGRVELHLLSLPNGHPDTGNGITGNGIYALGPLVLVEGAVPEPWRRAPAPQPGARPHESMDLGLLERMLRERFPGGTGATDEEIAAAESRLGIPLPDELRVLYQVRREWDDVDEDDDLAIELLPLDRVFLATVATRPCYWEFAAEAASVTMPDDEVQDLVGSPGWVVFGRTVFGDHVAIDLTPGPRGNIGQVITIIGKEDLGAGLYAHSLTAMVREQPERLIGGRVLKMPFVVRVSPFYASATSFVAKLGVESIEAAVGPDLEVLSIEAWEGEPISLAPVVGLPRLRSLTANPGTLADPLEIARLTSLEFLALGPQEWRILLDADAVPRSLLAAAIKPHGDRHPLPLVEIANELLARWDRPLITRALIAVNLSEAPPGPG